MRLDGLADQQSNGKIEYDRCKKHQNLDSPSRDPCMNTSNEYTDGHSSVGDVECLQNTNGCLTRGGKDGSNKHDNGEGCRECQFLFSG